MLSLVFDLDGTLLNSKESILRCIEIGFKEIGYPEIEFDREYALRQDLKTTVLRTAAKYSLSISEAQITSFIGIYRHHHSEDALHCISAFPKVREVLGELKRDFKLAVATTKHTEQAIHALECIGLNQFFDHIQGTDPGMKYKPSPDVLLAALAGLKVSAHASVYLGDSAHDLAAAAAAGMMKMGVTYGYSTEADLRDESPDWMIHQFEDLLNLKTELLGRLQARRES